MNVLVWLRFGQVHVPLRRRTWKAGAEAKITKNGQQYTIQILRPKTVWTHPIENLPPHEKVADANIPIVIACDLQDKAESFGEIAKVVLDYAGPLVEKARVQTSQPHLRLRRIADLEFEKVTTPEGEALAEFTTKYREWFQNQERDRPLPFISLEDWWVFQSEPAGDSPVPLYESLLLDAELEMETDSRASVLFAALACELFVQSWLRERAESDERLRKWLDWAKEKAGSSEGAVPIRTFYDLGLYFASKKTLKEDKELWKAFGKLIDARNGVAHRGRIPEGYDPKNAAETARQVINWVKELAVA